MKYKGIGKNVIIKKLPSDEAFESGLILYDNERRYIMLKGVVTSPGDKVKDINEGDRVIYRRFRAVELDSEHVSVNSDFVYLKY